MYLFESYIQLLNVNAVGILLYTRPSLSSFLVPW